MLVEILSYFLSEMLMHVAGFFLSIFVEGDWKERVDALREWAQREEHPPESPHSVG